MTHTPTEPEVTADASCRGSAPAHSTLKKRLLVGVSTLALLAAGSAYTLRAYSAEGAAGASPFGAASAARTPAAPITMPGFTDLVSAVKPAVVSVRVKTEAVAQAFGNGEDSNPFEGTPFEKFFKDFEGRNGMRMMPQGRGQPRQFAQGQGSGFFISADGYIVTNNHVVDHAVKVEVVTDTGATFEAKVVGTDPKTDLALIKVDGHTNFPFVKLADANPQVGEWVVAMGNPYGLGGTVTAGIVSARGRDIGSGPYDDFIQIDAPVNRGNSGGPTFNLKGEVIGVNTAIFSPSGGSIGIAFDIPASTVASVIPQLEKGGQVERGWLGVQIQPVTSEIADSLGLKTAAGALIAEAQAGSPATKAGLKPGDVITGVNDVAIKDPRDLARRIAAIEPHHTVALSVIRDGRDQTITVKLGQLSDKAMHKAASDDHSGDTLGSLGLTLAPAADVQGAGEKGLAVVSVAPDSKAAELGFQPGDIIVKAGNKALSSKQDLMEAMSEAKAAGRKNALVVVNRDHTDRYVAVPIVG